MKRDDRLWLTEIITACREIAAALEHITREAFLADMVLQGFVLNRITIIGEAASKVSTVLRDRHPEVLWKATIGMRNIVVHQYFAVDWGIIWDAATVDTPDLQRQISNILAEL
jgi:uncharacterized protein with HEPN domain